MPIRLAPNTCDDPTVSHGSRLMPPNTCHRGEKKQNITGTRKWPDDFAAGSRDAADAVWEAAG